MKWPRGFTLIELVMTLVIVGILAVFAAGRLDFTGAFQQRGVYDKVKAGLEYARKAAVAKRRYVLVTVDSTGNGAVSFLYDSNNPEGARSFAATNYLVLPAADRDCTGGNGNAVCGRSGVAVGLSSGTSPFTFNPEGGASATVAVSVTGMATITCSDGVSTGAICVENQTGYVH